MRPLPLLALALALLPIGSRSAPAESYPARPLTIVVPFPAGSSIDSVARILGEHMKTQLGQPVVVENVTGAGGSLAARRLAHALPDGYTIGIGNISTHVINGATYSLGYDVVADFAPISLLTSEPMLMLARSTMAARDLKELIAWLKANPDKATVAVGSRSDVTGIVAARFQRETGTRFQLVPYRGAGVAMTDLMAGRVDLILLPPSTALPQLRAGHVKAYAVMAASRLRSAPEIPTIDEAGLPGLHVAYWFAFWAPRNTPKPIIDAIERAVRSALADPSARARLTEAGREIFPLDQQTPEALAELQRAEITTWWRIIKEEGIKSE